MALSANALCAKAKAMYGNRIQNEGYMDLCRKQSVGEVVTYLKSQTKYSDVLSDINVRNVHRHQLEVSLEKEYFERCARLMKYVPISSQQFYMQEVMKMEVDIIIDKVTGLKEESNTFSLELPDYLASKTSFNIYELINLESFQELVEYFKGTKYGVIISAFDFTTTVDINDLEKQLMEFYYDNYIKMIKKLYKGRMQKQLLSVLYTSIELNTITKIYRLKKYFNTPSDQIRKMISLKYNRLPKVIIESMVEASDAKQFMQILAQSKYSVYSDPDDEFVYIEYYVEKIKYNVAKRYMRFSNEAPLVYITYCILQEIELDNLKHIIEGIRYNRDATSMEEMLIYV